MDKIRPTLFRFCKEYVEQRIQRISIAMKQLQEDLENESKSSAGDKYETGREMINIEWNKLTIQLNEYDRLAQILVRIKDHKPGDKVVLGSLVLTDAANYFISIPAGEIESRNQKCYAVGIKAPISQQLLGKEIGDHFTMNGKEFRILNII